MGWCVAHRPYVHRLVRYGVLADRDTHIMYHAITQAIQCCVVKVTTPFTGRLATLLVASLVGVGDGRYESHLAISPDKEHTQKRKVPYVRNNNDRQHR